MLRSTKRFLYAAWLAAIFALAALHAAHLSADFPNHSPWIFDWAKYTDEGWWTNAAVRAHLFGHWYLAGDFNPAVAQPVWPVLEWIAFSLAGVTLQAARALAVLFFFANLALAYLLVRSRAPRWAALLALTLLVSSPFLYAFSRLAILEPALIFSTLAALSLAVGIGRFRHPQLAAALTGLLLALMMLTKLSTVFLAPAIAWAMAASLIENRLAARAILRIILIAFATAALLYGLWILIVLRAGLLPDFRYLFVVNHYIRPSTWTWPFVSLWWSFHGALWIDRVLVPLAGLIIVAASVARRTWGRALLSDPAFAASFWSIAGVILFMTWQDHPQPRYYAVAAFFFIILIALGAAALTSTEIKDGRLNFTRIGGWLVIAIAASVAIANTARTISYAAHPQYTFVRAARSLAAYIAAHPNGRPMLVSVSGDEIMLITRLPALCDDFGTVPLPDKLARYRPGWFAAWNDLDPGTLQDLHTRYSVEQVGAFPAFDHPERTVLVLYKLHPLPNNEVREIDGPQDLRQPLPGDKIDVDMQ